MEDEKLIKIATCIMIITIITMLIFGIVYAIRGTLMTYHLDYIGKSEGQLRSENPKLMEVIGIIIRILGVTYISYSIILIIITYGPFRKAEKWARVSMFMAFLTVTVPFLIILSYAINLPFIIVLIDLILQIIALAISYKPIMKAK